MSSMRKLFTFPVFVLCVSLLAGCGDPETDRGTLGSLTGTVSFEGEPITEGFVHFSHTSKGHGASAAIGENGAYEVKSEMGGLPVGEYQVSIVPPMIEKDLGPDTPKAEVLKEMKNIPAKYHSASTSDLVVSVKKGKNNFDISMKKGTKKKK